MVAGAGEFGPFVEGGADCYPGEFGDEACFLRAHLALESSRNALCDRPASCSTQLRFMEHQAAYTQLVLRKISQRPVEASSTAA